MRRWLLLLFLFPFLCAHAQVNTDSLKSALQAKTGEPQEIKSLLYTAFKMSNDNDEAKLAIYHWAISKSEEKKYYEGEAMAYRFLGLYHRDSYDNAAATENMLKAIDIAEKNGIYNVLAQAYDGLSGIYDMANAYPKAIEYERKAIAAYDKAPNKKGLGSLYHNLGLMLHDSVADERKGSNNKEILYYFRMAIKLTEETTDSVLLLQVLNGAARIYGESKIFDTATQCLDRAEALIKKLNVPRFYSSHYLYRGGLFSNQKKYTDAIRTFQLGLSYAIRNKDPFYQSRYYDNLSGVYARIGDSAAAYRYHVLYTDLNDSLMSEEKLQTTALIDARFEKEKKDNEINKLKTEQALKELELERQKAIIAGNMLEAAKKENEIKRLMDEERIRQLELEKQKAVIAGNILEARRKEDEIRLLSQERELQELEITRQQDELSKKALQAKTDSQQIQLSKNETLLREKELSSQKSIRNYLVGGIALLSLIAFFLYRNIAAKRKAYRQLQDKSQQIKDQALQLSKQAKQIAQFQSQMNPHFVYNALHNIQGLVLTDEKQKANTQIQSLAQLMRKTFANAEKDDIPLEEEISYLEKYIDFEKNALSNNLNFEVTVSKEAEGTLIPPMMIQPFVENAIKHAELTKVQNPYIKVLIETENNLLAIQVKDNGTGLKKDVSQPDKLSHSMSVIKSRLDLIFKGRADVNSQPVFSIKTVPEIAEGTSIKFYLPINYSF